MTDLKPIVGMNQYCGPSVLATLTGKSTDECAAVISAVSGRKEIRAVDRAHLIEALRRLRFNIQEVFDIGGYTLYGTLFSLRTAEPGMYVVFVKYHVIAIEIKDKEIYICDNYTKAPLDIRQSARLSQKVERVIRVTKKSSPEFVRKAIIIRKAEYLTRLDIAKHYYFKDDSDDTEVNLGYIKYDSSKNLQEIITALENWEAVNIAFVEPK